MHLLAGAVAVDDAVFLGPLVFRFAPAGRGFLSPALQPVIHHLVKLFFGLFGFLFDDKKVPSTISDNFRIRQDVRFSCTILPFATTPGVLLVFPAMVYIHAVERFSADRGGSFRLVD